MAEYDLTGINLPFDPTAEEAVIGAVVGTKDMLGEVIETLRPEHFYIDRCREIYALMTQLYMSNEKIDVLTVGDMCVDTECSSRRPRRGRFLWGHWSIALVFPQ